MDRDDLYGPGSGGKVMDATPVAVPAGFKRPETMEERLRRFIRNELSQDMSRKGEETFDEANDFDIPDDPVDPQTPFEEFFDPTLGRAITPDEFRRYEGEYREAYLRAQAEAIALEDREAALRDAVDQARKSRISGAGGAHSPAPPAPEVKVPKTP